MRGLACAVLVAAFVLAQPARAGESDPQVSLAATDLALGAVPELRFARWPVDRWAAVYVRTADGSVVRLSLMRRGDAGEAGQALRLAHGAERRVWVGGRAGYVLSPRSGTASDREALIVLLAAGRPPAFGDLAPVAGALPPAGSPSADGFFRQLAGRPWLGDVEIHILPYRIGARDGTASDPAVPPGAETMLVFSGLSFEKVLVVADILAVETSDSPWPLHIPRPDAEGRVALRYRTALGPEALAGRLEKIAADLELPASVAADIPARRLEVSALRSAAE